MKIRINVTKRGLEKDFAPLYQAIKRRVAPHVTVGVNPDHFYLSSGKVDKSIYFSKVSEKWRTDYFRAGQGNRKHLKPIRLTVEIPDIFLKKP